MSSEDTNMQVTSVSEMVEKPKRVRKPRSKKTDASSSSSSSVKAKAKSKPRAKKSGGKSVVVKAKSKPRAKQLSSKSKAIKKKKPHQTTKTGTVIKRYSSSWIHFCNDMRKNPEYNELKFAEKNKVFSPIWKNMSDEEKKKYEDMHEEDKARYKREYLALTPEQAKKLDAIKRARRKKRREQHKDEPKKTSPYMLFVQHERPKILERFTQENNRTPAFPELGAYMGVMWNALSDVEKEKYNQMYKDLMSSRTSV